MTRNTGLYCLKLPFFSLYLKHYSENLYINNMPRFQKVLLLDVGLLGSYSAGLACMNRTLARCMDWYLSVMGCEITAAPCLCHRTRTTDTQRELFSKISNFWAWADKLGENFGGIWSIFGQFISTHFGTVSPLSMFSINQPLLLQTRSKVLRS